jgi:predicted metal-dependent enzyme (double-stranded beta helix superfamily)
MFDLDAFMSECKDVVRETDARRAIKETLTRALEKSSSIAETLGKNEGGINVVYNAPDLTVLNVVWAPHMFLPPHDHRMWAAIGIYGGTEDNTLYRRNPERIQAAGGRELHERDVLALGMDAIHSVRNPERRFTGAIHVYGGDFLNQPRSQWDPDTLIEQPYDLAHVMQLFEKANKEWAAQVGQDLDEDAS